MSKRHVLVIDDDFEMMQDDLKRGLEEYEFSVAGKTERSKALQSIKEENPDLVLLDIFFPDGMTGKLTLNEIKKNTPIFLS